MVRFEDQVDDLISGDPKVGERALEEGTKEDWSEGDDDESGDEEEEETGEVEEEEEEGESGEEESEGEEGESEEEEESEEDDEESGEEESEDEDEEEGEEEEYYGDQQEEFYDEHHEYYDEEHGEYYDEKGNLDGESDVAYDGEEQSDYEVDIDDLQEEFHDEPSPRFSSNGSNGYISGSSRVGFALVDAHNRQASFRSSGQKSQRSFRSSGQQSQRSFTSGNKSQRSFRPQPSRSGSVKHLINDDHIIDEGLTKREIFMYLGCCCCVFLSAFGALGGAFIFRQTPGGGTYERNYTISPAPTSSPVVTPTDAPTAAPELFQVSLTVDADTHIQDGDFSNVVFGSEDTLLVQNGEQFKSMILLSFDLMDVQFPSDNLFDESKRAILQLERVVSIADSPPTNVTVVKLPATPSPIERVSYNLYRPVNGVDGPVFTVSKSDESLVEVDITEFFFAKKERRERMLGQQNNDKRQRLRRAADSATQLLLMLEAAESPNSENGRLGVEFRSREFQDGSSAPKILVKYFSSTPATAAPVPATANPSPAPSTKISTKAPTVSPITQMPSALPSKVSSTIAPTVLNGTNGGGGGTLAPTVLNGTNGGGGGPSDGTEPSPVNVTDDSGGGPSNGTESASGNPPNDGGGDSSNGTEVTSGNATFEEVGETSTSGADSSVPAPAPGGSGRDSIILPMP